MANIIGDIAGQYKTLMALIQQMPDEEVISIGDMIDRGPQSKEVVEWFMANGRALLGNHEHLMLDHWDKTGYYQDGMWIYNGGGATLNSFGGVITPKVLDWVRALPKYLEIDDILVSHAFIHPSLSVKEATELGDSAYYGNGDISIIWNRQYPVRRDEYKLQLAGHNAHFGLKEFGDEKGKFAIGLDTSHQKVLTGFNTTTMQTYQQSYIY